MDTPEEENRVWMVWLVWVAAILLVGFMLVYTTVRADAQEPGRMLCADSDVFLRQVGEIKKQRPVWEGTAPSEPPAEVVILQSEKGEWSLFVIQAGRACLMQTGTDASPPISTGKGA